MKGSLIEFQKKRDLDRSIKNWYITDKELKEAYAEGERDFEGAHIEEGVFYCENLSDINLSKADLTSCQFGQSILTSANFQDAHLKRCDFIRASIGYADFRRVTMIGTTLKQSNLRESIFINASCDFCDFSRTDLYGADLSLAHLHRVDLYKAYCRQADFQEADLSESILESTNLDRANLWMASLKNAIFNNISFNQTNFLEAPGLYSTFSMTLSSRQDALHGGIILEDNKIKLRFWAGCKEKVTEAQLLESIQEKHGDNAYAKQYKSAIKAIKSMFKNDMSQGKWDYHLTRYKDSHS